MKKLLSILIALAAVISVVSCGASRKLERISEGGQGVDVIFSGSEYRTDKKYFKHTGWIGGIKETTAGKLLNGRFPERVIIKAVERMISRNPMGRQQMTKLKVYAGENHPHTAQNPEVLDLASRNPKNNRSK